MKQDEIKTIFKIWGVEDWPQSRVPSFVKYVTELVSLDSSYQSFTHIISGGDPVTRALCLRKISSFHTPGRVLVCDPAQPRDVFTPWIYKSEEQEKVMEKFDWPKDDFLSGLREIVSQALLRLQVRGQVFQTKDACALLPGRPHLFALKKIEGQDFGVWDDLSRHMARAYTMPFLSSRPELIGGRVDNFWHLSGKRVGDIENIYDFALHISPLQPISDTHSLWCENLSKISQLKEERMI